MGSPLTSEPWEIWVVPSKANADQYFLSTSARRPILTPSAPDCNPFFQLHLSDLYVDRTRQPGHLRIPDPPSRRNPLFRQPNLDRQATARITPTMHVTYCHTITYGSSTLTKHPRPVLQPDYSCEINIIVTAITQHGSDFTPRTSGNREASVEMVARLAVR